MTDQKVTVKYTLVLVVVVFITWIVHEFAHWFTSEYLGYETVMRINGVSVVDGENPTELHKTITSSAGPIITVIQGIIAFLILKSKKWNKYVYAFLFIAFIMRLLASFMNLIMLNDEGRISNYLNLGTYTLPILVSGFLFFMVYKISKKYKLKWKFQVLTYIIVIIAITALIFLDQTYKIRLL